LLDDLGAHRVSDWVEDTVTSIITARCNNQKPLIATTNLIDPEAGYATYERTAEGKVDYRTTLSERIGPRARLASIRNVPVIKMPIVDDSACANRAEPARSSNEPNHDSDRRPYPRFRRSGPRVGGIRRISLERLSEASLGTELVWLKISASPM